MLSRLPEKELKYPKLSKHPYPLLGAHHRHGEAQITTPIAEAVPHSCFKLIVKQPQHSFAFSPSVSHFPSFSLLNSTSLFSPLLPFHNSSASSLFSCQLPSSWWSGLLFWGCSGVVSYLPTRMGFTSKPKQPIQTTKGPDLSPQTPLAPCVKLPAHRQPPGRTQLGLRKPESRRVACG